MDTTTTTTPLSVAQLMADTTGKLKAKGRITEQTAYRVDKHSHSMAGVKYNTFGKVDGARLMSYNSESNTVEIRVDHSETPTFWLEIQLPLDQLKQWIEGIK